VSAYPPGRGEQGEDKGSEDVDRERGPGKRGRGVRERDRQQVPGDGARRATGGHRKDEGGPHPVVWSTTVEPGQGVGSRPAP
jgi:hypothetical protein